MDLVLLLNGKAKQILNAHNMDPEKSKVLKIDEKKLASPKYIKSITSDGGYENIYFACQDLDLQRFQFFMKYYIFSSKPGKGAIIDEAGRKNIFSLAAFLFRELPFLFFEVILSGFVVVYYYVKLPVLKWLLIKNN